MDFGTLPPEINSGRMYSGAGPGPMLAAAVAWDDLAAELHSAAGSYESVIANLTGGPWLGPASASMAAAAAAHVGWLTATAAQAEQTASQASAAAGAFEAAFAMTVPPPVIATNRSLLMSLVATNILGQNTSAIATTEVQYAEMWAQDAAAMYGYAGTSASSTTLTPFTLCASGTNPGWLPGQPAAVAHATGASVATSTPTILSELTSAVPTALQGLATPLQSTLAVAAPTTGLAGILQSLGLTSPVSFLTPLNTGLTATGLSGSYAGFGSASHADAAIISTQDQIRGTEVRIMNRFDRLGPLTTPGLAGSAGLGAGEGPAAVSAAFGRAGFVGVCRHRRAGPRAPRPYGASRSRCRQPALIQPRTGWQTAREPCSPS
jgi:PPE-repeat protein